MNSGEFIFLSLSTLMGGALGSFGLNVLAQRPLLRSIIQRWRWWGLVLFYAVIILTVAAGVTAIVRRVLAAGNDMTLLNSPSFFFLFGFLAGLPFTLPTVTSVWRARDGRTGRRAKPKPATPQQRTEFARGLEKQLREYIDASRSVHLKLQGEKGNILLFEGDITRQEGERLVAALRGDLMDVEIERVEGEVKGSKWWVRVHNEPKKK